MKQFEDLQSLIFYKEKLVLPHGKNNKAKGYMFYSLNNSLDSLAILLKNQHPILSNMGNLYHTYYYDYTVVPTSIKSEIVKFSGLRTPEARVKRLADYDIVTQTIDGIKTPLVIRETRNVNFVYDLTPITDLYCKQEKLKKTTLVRQLKAYFASIHGVVSKSIPGYNKDSYILVNLDEYSAMQDKRGHILYNIYALMRRSPKIIEQFKQYPMTFLFYTDKGYFKISTSDISKDNRTKLLNMVKRCKPDVTVEQDVTTVEKEQIRDALVQQAMTMNLTGDNPVDPDNVNPEDILDADDPIVTKVQNSIEKKKDDHTEDNDTKSGDIDEDLLNDEAFKAEYVQAMSKKQIGQKTTAASLKRDELLRKQQADIKIKNKTIRELTKESHIPAIVKHSVNNDLVTNQNLKTLNFTEMDKTYNNELYDKDIADAVTCLNDKSIPVNIVKVDVKDTSDTLTFKETYTFTLEDAKRGRHTMKFSLPKFIDDRFIYINGSKKTIQNQLFALPVVKIGPDSVQITTNYNKIIMSRFGRKFNPNFEKFKKMIDNKVVTNVKKGCNSELNKAYLTCLEYDQFAELYTSIQIGNNKFIFNMEDLISELGDKYKEATLTNMQVGYNVKTKEPIVYKPDGISDLISLMLSEADASILEEFGNMTSGKKFIHSKATVMAKKIPVVLLICYFDGLTKVLHKFNDPNITFTDKKERDTTVYNYIKFADGFLKYPIGDTKAAIMFNGLAEFNTVAYTISSLDDRTTYIDIFSELYGSAGVGMADALINYSDFMIDPITLNILKTMNYPTDLVSLIIFANNMLVDNQFTTDIDLHNYRLRRNEVVPAMLYKAIAKAYTRYRRTANNPNPAKISMDENMVIKELISLPTVEDYSELSPMVEVHKQGTASMKGSNGMNLDRAYKLDKRAFHNSMTGVVGMSTDPGPNGGKIRQLVAEPTVINARGFFELNNRENTNLLTDANLMTPIEMLTPMTATHDDNNRNAMASKQTCHAIPVEGNCPALVSTGMDQMIHYRTGNSFSVVAKEDGKVIELNEDKELMIIQYKSGKKQAIDLSTSVVKNGGGGFYLTNKLTPKFKQGQSFKQDTILAYDKRHYKDLGPFGNRLTMGSLIKVAIASNYATYEDSTFVTKRMSEDMATNISMPHSVILGNNANVEYIVKVGDNVTIGDDLIRYEASYDDSELNRLLANVRADLKEEIVNLGKSQVHSHYTGVVSDINIYCTVPNDQLSPTLKKIVSDYQKNIKSRKAVLDKYEPESKGSVVRMDIAFTKNDDITKPDEYGKVKGRDVGDGVLIEFYVTYHDELSDGETIQLSQRIW